MSKSRTAPSTPRLSEYARHFSYPVGITKTVWPRVEAKGKELGLGFDWWQSQLGTVCLGYGADGKYVATVGGIGLSIPRQVGKTYFVMATLIIMCILFPGLQVVWTSHHLRTTQKLQTTIQGMSRRKKIAPHIKTVRTSHGEGQVEFANGSVIMFGARAQGFGRGFDEIDVEVFDEAQILDTKALEDMIAATNQSRHVHGALLFFMGTPPRPTDTSDSFALRRKKAHEGKSPHAVWLEIGADPKSDVDDRSQWPAMNPSYPARTPTEAMLRLRENLGDEDSWNREGRGIWDDATGTALFGEGRWEAARGERPAGLKMGGLSVASSMHLDKSAVVGAGVDADDVVHVVPLQHGAGTGWVVDRAKQLQEQHGVDVAIDGKGPAAVLIPHLERAGVRLRVLNTENVKDACGDVYNRVQDGRFRHAGYPELDAAVAVAMRRDVGDRWALGRKKSESDISTLEAAMFAAWMAALPAAPTAYDDHDLLVI